MGWQTLQVVFSTWLADIKQVTWYMNDIVLALDLTHIQVCESIFFVILTLLFIPKTISNQTRFTKQLEKEMQSWLSASTPSYSHNRSLVLVSECKIWNTNSIYSLEKDENKYLHRACRLKLQWWQELHHSLLQYFPPLLQFANFEDMASLQTRV